MENKTITAKETVDNEKKDHLLSFIACSLFMATLIISSL